MMKTSYSLLIVLLLTTGLAMAQKPKADCPFAKEGSCKMEGKAKECSACEGGQKSCDQCPKCENCDHKGVCPHCGQKNCASNLASQLGLTEEQNKKVQVLHQEHHKKQIELKKEMHKLHNELQDQIKEEKPNKNKISKISKKLGELKAQMIENKTLHKIDMKALLNPEQAKKFMEMHAPEEDKTK